MPQLNDPPNARSILTHHGCRVLVRLLSLLLITQFCSVGMSAYSVLTHEEVVDLLWTEAIRPLILKRYPGLSEEQVNEAHAYAYGGAVFQDLGYYPFGSVEFSDLVHYVRSGEFVRELLLQSQDADEYAFALGALAHYISDIDGHPAVNQAVAIQYPKLRAKYGNSVEYAQNKTAHLKTEFSFDMVQVAKQRYAPQQYHDFIGFRVSKPLLERVFPLVYGLPLSEVLPHADLSISGPYQRCTSTSSGVMLMDNSAEICHKTSGVDGIAGSIDGVDVPQFASSEGHHHGGPKSFTYLLKPSAG